MHEGQLSLGEPEQLQLFEPKRLFAGATILMKISPLSYPHEMGSFDDDRRRYDALDSAAHRKEHLFGVLEEVSPLRCLRDTRVIYNIDLSDMAQLVGLENAEDLAKFEKPEVCQDPEYEIDGIGLIQDVMRLFVVLDELGYSKEEVKQIIVQDIKASSELTTGGGYQQFIGAVEDYLPYIIESRARKKQ